MKIKVSRAVERASLDFRSGGEAVWNLTLSCGHGIEEPAKAHAFIKGKYDDPPSRRQCPACREMLAKQPTLF